MHNPYARQVFVDPYNNEIEYPNPGTIRIVNRKDLPPRSSNTIRIAIDRPHLLGNPFIIGRDGDRETVIKKYREWLNAEFCKNPRDPHLTPIDREMMRIHKAYLDGKDVHLVCNCHPLPCHGQVIKEIIEKL
ncbi:hypothetical protein Dvar_40910 [Desulfosarcina variabilis str. Montpellier]|uniref:DUF4326 domain-containing protein n=1 Tax=Desulfosarcina variabilis TaxID=2300 RepID=UPI003AFB0380